MIREVDLLRFPRIKREIGRRTEEHRAIARRFDEQFFDGSRDVGYGGYLDDGRWRQVAARMVLFYALKPGARILDIGCAKGFLVRDLCALGMDAYGLDISDYAIRKSVIPERTICGHVMEMAQWRLPSLGRSFDLVVSINTLHNLPQEPLSEVVRWLSRITSNCYVTLDAWRDPEGEERMRAWNLTAQTMMSVEKWLLFLGHYGYFGDVWWFEP